MRVVIQRVKNASVTVDGELVSSIGPGLMCLIGINREDEKKDQEWLLKKIIGAKLWPNEDKSKNWDRNVQQSGFEILFVSQFTLYGVMNKGTKPDFHLAMESARSKQFYDEFLEMARKAYNPDKIKDGKFGAMMDVQLVNDGPVMCSTSPMGIDCISPIKLAF
eukprot:gene6690-8276_t